MTTTGKYYDLLFDIDSSNFIISLLEKDDKYKEDLKVEIEKNIAKKNELDTVKLLLNEEINQADSIRTGYISITNGILHFLEKIEQWPEYYPDLNQGMIIPGYLFGLILNDYHTNLKSEGSYHPVPYIYMSQNKWPVADFKTILIKLKNDLQNIHFNSNMHAINFFTRITKDFDRQMHILKELKLM